MIETLSTTEDLPWGERFANWNELTSRAVLPTRARCHDEAGFQASALVLGSGTLQISTGTSWSSYSAARTQKLIRQSDPERYLLGVVRSGRPRFSQGNHDARLSADDLIVLDSSQPFTSHHEPGKLETLILPKALLPLPAAQVAPLLAQRLPGNTGIGAVLARCLQEIACTDSRYRGADIIRLLDTALELLAALLAHELQSPHALSPESQQHSLLARVQSFIHQHLADPDLSPATVAHAHHISLRRLQQVLATAGTTPAALIRRKRLQQCQRALLDPGHGGCTIRTIAARWGFTSHAHFTRLFHATHGSSPSEYRASHGSLLRTPTSPPHD
ncbi:helix-turn-helix domain-containing protein [Streptomyces flavofungini]|uniref:Helix-turn-helix domain-containing protein n=1 Tax=Streptomyces flavofungini TaxID=68200 RepID=A0ABS0X256_9ACTN|nr:helix-turn-helix domain-containing protein [Streptomyces flavofungini]MBJ3807124.1 helix-turn-helix domain-containing protein [Streptomyces flavofungini]GHC74866.1 AraC family transcriptional regulator [Streptomyces flavofungini]